MNLNYSELIKNSFSILRNNKALWFFGALISLFGSAFNSATSATDIVNMIPNKEQSMKSFGSSSFMSSISGFNIADLGGLIIIVILLAFVFVLLVFIINTISTIAIIKLGNEAASDNKVSIKQGFKEGFNYLIQIIGLNLLIYVPFAILTLIIGALFISPGVILAVMMKEKTIGVILAVLGALAWLLILIVSSIFVSVVNLYAARFIVIKDIAIFESIKSGYALLMKYKEVAIIVWFVNLGLGFVVGIVNYVVALLLGMPAALLSKFVSVYFNALLIIPFISTVIIIGGFTVVSYNIWTLSFSKMTENSLNSQ